jgi:tetratricopeptide (TPR) repeat protein
MTMASPTPAEAAELDALIALAQREHRAGRLAEAAAAYCQIVALRPDIAEAHNNLGVVLRGQGQLDEAVARFEQALQLRPNYVEAHSNLGATLKQQGKLQLAQARFEQALAIRPDYAEAHNNLGNVLLAQDKLDEAAACYERALALRPGYAEAHNNLGNVLLRQGKLDEAAARYQQALRLRPDHAEAHYNLGNVLRDQGKLDDAAACYRQAIALRPDYAEAHNNLGTVLVGQENLDEGVACYEQALAFQPGYAEAHYNLGYARKQQGKLEQAVVHYEQALALKPAYVDAHHNLGNALGAQGKLGEAAARYQQALALRPDWAEAQLGLATCYLLGGDYQRGWPAYEARLQITGLAARPDLPRWNGEPLTGRSLLLVAEQGLGDAIQFVRYARLLKERGAKVVLACRPALGRLLASCSDVDELFIVGSAEEWPRCDYYLPLLSAPLAVGTTAATIPREVPYLWADAELIDRWRREMAEIEGFKIGIAWQGSPDFPLDRQRSISLAQFAPLARVPGVRLVSLQKGFGAEQMATVDFPVVDLSDRLDEAAGPFMDTAAVMRSVDLVVTSDTAIAHLAGALGLPVWVALHFSAEWRWLRGRDDSPWYPTMRLFRQSRFGEWPDVFERMAAAVEMQPLPREDGAR